MVMVEQPKFYYKVININMRCIEISPFAVHIDSAVLININMRCIEIRMTSALTSKLEGLTLT